MMHPACLTFVLSRPAATKCFYAQFERFCGDPFGEADGATNAQLVMSALFDTPERQLLRIVIAKADIFL